jgi:hypothetical protein
MVLWALVETEMQEVIEFFSERESAEEALADVLHDEPDWVGLLVIQPFKLQGFSLN